MKSVFALLACMAFSLGTSAGAVSIDEDALGKSLGGWLKRSKKYAQYQVSGVKYRTYRPECTVTPDGGIYVSLRIDHIRGMFSSDDHAVLEITVNQLGHITSAKSSIAIQGRSISSDVIEGVNKAGNATSGIDKAVQIGTDLVTDLSSKLLRTKVVEPGRVAFPSAVRHNYNLLYQSIRMEAGQPAAASEIVGPAKAIPVIPPSGTSVPLTIEGYRSPTVAETPKPAAN